MTETSETDKTYGNLRQQCPKASVTPAEVYDAYSLLGEGEARTGQVLSDNEDFIAQVEEVEAKLSGGRGMGDVETDDEADDEWVESVDDVYVRPRGYDKEFWEELINDDYGGSNAVELMCTANDAFDHRVITNITGRKKGQFGGKIEGSPKGGNSLSGDQP